VSTIAGNDVHGWSAGHFGEGIGEPSSRSANRVDSALLAPSHNNRGSVLLTVAGSREPVLAGAQRIVQPRGRD
jgi:hypothetical protein